MLELETLCASGVLGSWRSGTDESWVPPGVRGYACACAVSGVLGNDCMWLSGVLGYIWLENDPYSPPIAVGGALGENSLGYSCSTVVQFSKLPPPPVSGDESAGEEAASPCPALNETEPCDRGVL